MRRLLKLNNAILILLISSTISPAQANQCQAWKPEFAHKKNLVIGKITILPLNIFEAYNHTEAPGIHRIINKLHIKTKRNTIKNQLLFHHNEPFKPEILAETERYLRAQKYIKDALIVPTELCEQHVSIKVMTRDTWTFTPGINYGRSGGNNKVGLEIQEQNILGYGKDIRLRYTKTSERNSTNLSYQDNHLFGSHTKLNINLLNNSDGKGYDLSLGLPFYKKDSQKSWGLKTSNLSQLTPLYEAGKVLNKIKEKKQRHSLYYGWATPSNNKNTTQRFTVGWTLKKEKYFNPIKPLQAIKSTESYPWIEINRFKTKYLQKTNFNTMGVVEDIPLSYRYTFGAGLLLKDAGSTDDYLKLTSLYTKGIQLSPTLLSFIELKTDNYLGRGPLQGGTYRLKAELNHLKNTGNDIRLTSTFNFTDSLQVTKRIYAGGNTGLRGYPLAYQGGNKSLIFQAEKRLHFEWYPLKLVKFGAVAFTDIGSAWGINKKPKILANIGIGLRMIPTRASSAKTMHLNLAMPLTQRQNINKIQLSISTAKSF